MDNNSLAHSKWNCKYHIVFAPKYRRLVIYGKLKKEIGEILRMLCKRKGVEILEAEACPDHIPYVGKYTTKIFSSRDNGIFERKKFIDYI